jgi:hypothetical protein
MAPDSPSDRPPEEVLAELDEQKEDEVLHREPVEQDLMQHGRSEVGTEIDGVEDEADGE